MKETAKKPRMSRKELNEIFPVDAPFDHKAFERMLKRARKLSIFDIDELEKRHQR